MGMRDIEIHHEYPTGDLCPGCDCEVILVALQGETYLFLECDCGDSMALAPEEVAALQAAA